LPISCPSARCDREGENPV